MRVTRFNYPLNENLIKKLDALSHRCTTGKRKRDSVLIIEGPEGEGKTTYSVAIGYYLSEKTGREFSEKNVFLDAEKMLNYAKSTEEKILIWDEPSLKALSGDSRKKIVKNLIRLLMTCRKKRHFIMINITYFNRFGSFGEYVISERANGMLHLYTRPRTEQARFIYIKEKMLMGLWADWWRRRQKNYFKYGDNNTRGEFPPVLDPSYKYNVLSEFDIDDYEKRKDEVIMQIGEENKMTLQQSKLLKLQYYIHKASRDLKINKEKLSEILGYSRQSIDEWKKIPLKYPHLLET